MRISEHRTFLILLATIVLVELAHGIEIVSVLPLYLTRQFHQTETFVGVVASIYLLVDALLVRTPAGLLADRWGRKRTLTAGLLLSAIPILFMLAVNDPLDWIPINVLNGIGAGMVWPAIYALVADTYGRERRGTVLALINMVMLGGIAIGGPIVGNVLLQVLGYPDSVAFTRALTLCFFFVLLALLLVVTFVREPPHAVRGEGGRPALGAWRAAAPFWMLLGIGLVITLAIGLIVPVITLFGTEVLRLSPSAFALVLVPPALTAGFALLPAGRWADLSGRERPLFLGLLFLAVAFWGAPLTVNPVIVSLGGMAAGFGYALLVPAWNALVMDWVPAEARGVFLGLVATVQGVGLAAGPALGGWLWNSGGPYMPFTAAAVLFTFGLGFAALRHFPARRMEGAGGG